MILLADSECPIRVRGCTGLSGPSLSAYARMHVFAWRGPYKAFLHVCNLLRSMCCPPFVMPKIRSEVEGATCILNTFFASLTVCIMSVSCNWAQRKSQDQTQQAYNVKTTSYQRHDVASTMIRHRDVDPTL